MNYFLSFIQKNVNLKMFNNNNNNNTFTVDNNNNKLPALILPPIESNNGPALSKNKNPSDSQLRVQNNNQYYNNQQYIQVNYF